MASNTSVMMMIRVLTLVKSSMGSLLFDVVSIPSEINALQI